MSKYKCPCNDEIVEKKNVTFKIIEGKVCSDVKCSCGKYMELDAPERNYTKEGCASLGKMDRYGRSS